MLEKLKGFKINNKFLIIMLFVLLILFFSILIFVKTYENDNSKQPENEEGIVIPSDDINNDNFSNNTTIIEGIKMEQTDVIGIVQNNHNIISIEDNNKNIKLSYPVITYNSDKITNLNNLIKSKIDKNIDDLNNYYTLEDMPTCLTVKMLKTNKEITFEHFTYYKYDIVESDNYISIIEKIVADSSCASGSSLVNDIYLIDKNTKEVLYQNDLKNNIDNNAISKILNYVKDNEDVQLYNIILDSVSNKTYFAYYSKNNNISFVFKSVPGNSNIEYQYNH